MASVTSLTDLNSGFPANWIDDAGYLAVKLAYTNNGQTMEAIGKHHQFNQDQLTLLQQMPPGNSIEVTIDYNNTNSATGEISERQIKFSRYLIPSTPATYPDSDQTMNDYFNVAIVNKILSNPFIYTSTAEGSNGLPSIVTQFKINEEGKVSELIITQPSDLSLIHI